MASSYRCIAKGGIHASESHEICIYNSIGLHTSKCRSVPRDGGIGPFRLLAKAVKNFNGEELSKLSGMMPPSSLSSAQVKGGIHQGSVHYPQFGLQKHSGSTLEGLPATGGKVGSKSTTVLLKINPQDSVPVPARVRACVHVCVCIHVSMIRETWGL